MKNIEELLQDFSRNLSGGHRLLRDLERSMTLVGCLKNKHGILTQHDSPRQPFQVVNDVFNLFHLLRVHFHRSCLCTASGNEEEAAVEFPYFRLLLLDCQEG